jgi:hypothetical protein
MDILVDIHKETSPSVDETLGPNVFEDRFCDEQEA